MTIWLCSHFDQVCCNFEYCLQICNITLSPLKLSVLLNCRVALIHNHQLWHEFHNFIILILLLSAAFEVTLFVF